MGAFRITAAEAAAISVNVSLKRPIDAKTLIGVFKGTVPLEGWKHHVSLFFSDVPSDVQLDFMTESGLSPSDMLAVYNQLSPAMRSKHILETIHGDSGNKESNERG